MSSPRKKILVVEDDLRQLMVATMRMVRRGRYKVESAERGDQALMLARELDLALIVMDVMLPGMDGIQATRRIREFDPEVPILIVTAYGEKYRGPAMEAGATEFLVKGAGLAEIIETVERLLGVRRE